MTTITTPTPAQIKTTKYSNKVFPLSKEAYEQLKASIARHKGLYIPIAINKTGDVLDGHHRLQACQELGISPTFEVRNNFKSELEEELFVYEINRIRRQLTTFQSVELALKEKPILAELARRNMKAGKALSRHQERVHVDKALAHTIGVSKDTLYKVEKVLKAAEENPNRELSLDYEGRLGHIKGAYPTYTKVVEDARRGKLKPNEAYNIILRDQRKEQRYAEIAEAAKSLNLPDKVVLLNRDSMSGDDIPEIKDGSADLILTDPPYLDKDLPLFDKLAQFAVKKLKPGGGLVFFYGHYQEPAIQEIFRKYKDELTYWWTFCVRHESARGDRMYTRGIIVDWKPMMYFVKGDKRLPLHYLHDFIQSGKANKMAHPWAQGREEAEYVISNLTLSKDALVVDPFMGSGEFLIPAIKLGRYVVGIEKDKQTFENARNYITMEASQQSG